MEGSVLIAGPDTRVVELRVPGTPGTPPEVLVDAVAAVDVGGDGVGRLVRPADRLRRPAPGPVLNAGGRPLPRLVEGYLWGGMTAGGPAAVSWALLFPFTLVNAATWMLPPVPTDSPAARRLAAAARAVLRLAGLLLTVLLVGQLDALAQDLVATTRLLPWARVLCAATVPLLAIGVLARVSAVRWSAPADGQRPVRRPAALSGLPGVGPAGEPAAPALRATHLVAAPAALAWLTVGDPAGPIGLACWAAALLLLGLAAIGALSLRDPGGSGPRRALAALPRRIAVGLTVAVLAAAITIRCLLPGGAPKAGWFVAVVAIALAGCCLVFGLLLAPMALLARHRWAGLPTALRPWAGGWLAAPVLTLAALLGFGLGAALSITARFATRLTAPVGAAPVGDVDVLIGWGVAGVLCLLLAAWIGGAALLRGWPAARRGRSVPPEVSLLHPDQPADAELAARAWWWASWQRRHAHRAVLALTAALPAATLASALLPHRVAVGWVPPLVSLGVLTLVVLVVVLLRSGYLAGRRPLANRRGGALTDLVRHWPRAAHPVVPPCPALKAAPELAQRAAEHLDDPNTRVVIAGDGASGVLAAAVTSRLLASLPDRDRARVGLLTAGSPIRWAYARAFPAVLPHDELATLYGDLGGRWRSLCRGTDPVGGGTTTWRRQEFDGTLIGVGLRPDSTDGALAPATAGPTGALVLGGDHWLPDPQHRPVAGRRWTPGVRGHGDYCADPEWDRAVACAAGLVTADQAASEFPVFRLPTRRPAAAG
ncbi:MAG TPA: hypothetical protein VG317_19215 [Pseudonocardiaceae bacterium]|nr:hypothetical protein [Pseudonocardiaceae bacterium]